MLFKKPRLGYFASHTARALDYQSELYRDKILECLSVKRENDALRETVVKQRIALDALNEAHRADARRMTEQMSALRHQVSVLSSERDRYRSALRRTFPSQAEEAAIV